MIDLVHDHTFLWLIATKIGPVKQRVSCRLSSKQLEINGTKNWTAIGKTPPSFPAAHP